MQCTWKNLARHYHSRAIHHPILPFSSQIQLSSRRQYATAIASTKQSSLPIYIASSSHSSFFHNALAHSPLLDVRTPASTDHQQLSAVQLTQAAAQAIRLSVNSRNLSDAFSILNSLHSAGSASSPAPLTSKHQSLINAIRAHSSHNGGVSSRLPAHALLHALIRNGDIAHATKLSEQVLSAGLKIRSRSMDAMVGALGQAGLQSSEGAQVIPKLHTRSVLSKSTHILPLPSRLSFFTDSRHADSMSAGSPVHKQTGPSIHSVESAFTQPSHLTHSQPAQFALRLLALARQARQRRTRTFFRTLITLCLINGEIILASLVFGALVRDWQSSKDMQASVTTEDATSKMVQQADTPYPSREQLHDICRTIDVVLEAYPLHSSPSLLPVDMEPPDNPDIEEAMPRQASLQALANLAYMIEQGAMGIGGLAPLIRVLGGYIRDARRVMKSDREFVWVASDKTEHGAVMVDAANYFERVLLGMIRSLHTTSSSTSRPHVAPHIQDIQTHNALLHFALTQSTQRNAPRKVYKLAAIILQSVQSNHKGGDETTRNILRRSSFLLKDSPDIQRFMSQDKPTLAHLIKSGASPYTLSTEMSYLISTGKPQEVVSAIDDLLPGLFRGPVDGVVVQRAVTLGPIIFNCLLNALQKLGKTTMAERVYRLAREAERLSWTGPKPWFLPIHIYTVMMRVYGAEARKSVPRGSEIAKGWGIGAHSDIRRAFRSSSGSSFESRRHKQLQRRRVKATQLKQRMSRRDTGLYMSVRLYLESMAREQQLRKVCGSGVQSGKNRLQPPVLDARFYDALLSVINKSSIGEGVSSQRVKRTLSYHRRQLRIAKEAYAFEGRVFRNRFTSSRRYRTRPATQQPASGTSKKLRLRDIVDEKGAVDMHALLLHVVRDMHRRGIEVPMIFKKAVVGLVDDSGVRTVRGIRESRVKVWVERRSNSKRVKKGQAKCGRRSHAS